MVMELTAMRLVARYLGSSLYSWTSVIGTVLAGIALGNFAGGWLADRFNPLRTLMFLFFLASGACLLIPLLNRIIGEGLFFEDVFLKVKGERKIGDPNFPAWVGRSRASRLRVAGL